MKCFAGFFLVFLMSCSASLHTTGKPDSIDPDQNKISLALTTGQTAEIYSSSTQKNIEKTGTFNLQNHSETATSSAYEVSFVPKVEGAATEKPTLKFKFPGPKNMTTTTTADQVAVSVQNISTESAVDVSASDYSVSVDGLYVIVAVKSFNLATKTSLRFVISVAASFTLMSDETVVE